MNREYMSCKEYAKELKASMATSVEQYDTPPCLSIIQVGDNQASNSYVKGKIRDCQEVGVVPKHIKLDADISQKELNSVVLAENVDESVHGIIVQLPLPEHLNEKDLLRFIAPAKDVDGFRSDSLFTPCTPLGILQYLKWNNVKLSGKHCVVLGRSDIVGKPMAKLLLQEDATVTVCHSKTKNLDMITRMADVIIVAVGRKNILNGDMVKEGTIVVDVGINRNEDGKLCGDCEYDSLVDMCSLITPVPGGVGLLTRVTLLKNTMEAQLHLK